MSVGAVATQATSKPAGLTTAEERRKSGLQDRLCAVKELSCTYVTTLFTDPRLIIYAPPEPVSQESTPLSKEPERNPYLTTRFGLLTAESLERCRGFVQEHAFAFDAAYRIYGVPQEVICGILRIETDFGIPTKLSPSPLGTIPAINRLVTLYVRQPRQRSPNHFARRQQFAFRELKDFLEAASRFGWDVFQIPGSPTGAIGLMQFEPSSFNVAVDGDGDGKIDLFDPADAIASVAHYLVTHGWDSEPQHQERAIYAYYGGNYRTDRNKYYMKAVLKYAADVGPYLRDLTAEPETALMPAPAVLQQQKTSPVDPSGLPRN
jgi:membrane-bound lytic murein transglycosylase B